MATYTSHYNLKKPATSDKIRIADFNGNADIIDGQMYDNETLGAKLKADIGIVENTNTATHNISAGQYVIWKGDLYTASSAISSGATLSDANLTAVSGGGLNALNSNINSISVQMTTLTAGNLLTSGSDLLDAPVGTWSYRASDNLTNTPCNNGLVRVYKTSSSTQWTLIIVNDPVAPTNVYINMKAGTWSEWKKITATAV